MTAGLESVSNQFMMVPVNRWLMERATLSDRLTAILSRWDIYHWTRGSLPASLDDLCAIGMVKGRDRLKTVSFLLDRFFSRQENGSWVHPALHKSKVYADAKINKRKAAGAIAANARWHPVKTDYACDRITDASPPHPERTKKPPQTAPTAQILPFERTGTSDSSESGKELTLNGLRMEMGADQGERKANAESMHAIALPKSNKLRTTSTSQGQALGSPLLHGSAQASHRPVGRNAAKRGRPAEPPASPKSTIPLPNPPAAQPTPASAPENRVCHEARDPRFREFLAVIDSRPGYRCGAGDKRALSLYLVAWPLQDAPQFRRAVENRNESEAGTPRALDPPSMWICNLHRYMNGLANIFGDDLAKVRPSEVRKLRRMADASMSSEGSSDAPLTAERKAEIRAGIEAAKAKYAHIAQNRSTPGVTASF